MKAVKASGAATATARPARWRLRSSAEKEYLVQEVRLDLRRRRLGLRHRLRRPGPRAGFRRGRQRHGLRHRGVLQHRRPGLQGHPASARWRSSPRPARRSAKKSLAEIAMSYGYVYVAQIAMGADMNQTIKAHRRGRELSRPLPHHRLRPLRDARHQGRHDQLPDRDEEGRRRAATGTCSASIPRSRPRARTRSRSTARRRPRATGTSS